MMNMPSVSQSNWSTTQDNIRRLINNQRQEYTPHAFRSAHAGMADFNDLYPVLRGLPVEELGEWMRRIDEMRATHEPCVPCVAKILAYSVLFTRGLMPDLSEHYLRLYLKTCSGQRPPERDFMQEVIDSLMGRMDPPSAEAHKQNWRRIALEMALENNPSR